MKTVLHRHQIKESRESFEATSIIFIWHRQRFSILRSCKAVMSFEFKREMLALNIAETFNFSKHAFSYIWAILQSNILIAFWKFLCHLSVSLENINKSWKRSNCSSLRLYCLAILLYVQIINLSIVRNSCSLNRTEQWKTTSFQYLGSVHEGMLLP